jgi:hypothetical protein
MSSAEAAAAIVDRAIERGPIGRGTLRSYRRLVRRHVAGYRRMVDTFYTEAFSRMCFFPESRLNLAGACLSLLAGDMDPAWRVRWRLEMFYRVAQIYQCFDAGPRVTLQPVFWNGDEGRTDA